MTTYGTYRNPEFLIVNPTFKKVKQHDCNRNHAKMAAQNGKTSNKSPTLKVQLSRRNVKHG